MDKGKYPNRKQPSKLKVWWGVVAAFLVGTVLVLDFFLKFIGFVEIMIDFVAPPRPAVQVNTVKRKGGLECLEFAFTNLPKNFELGKIRLDVNSTKGPISLSGEMAAEITEIVSNVELQPKIFSGEIRNITFRAAFQSEKRRDSTYVDFCPILSVPGMGGSLTVVPTFLRPDGTNIDSIDVSPSNSIAITVSRPKNLVSKLETDTYQVLSR